MRRIDRRADDGVDASQGFVDLRLRPENERRTFKPANSFELDTQLRLAGNSCQHRIPRSLLVNRRRVVDGKCKMRPIAEGAHRGLNLEHGNLIPQPLDLAC